MEQRHPFFGPDGLDWARAQLAEAGYEQSTAAHLTRKVHELLAPYVEAGPETVLAVLPVIAQLLQGKPLSEEFWSEQKRATATYVWRPITVRGVHVGDTVRVKDDAYEGHVGRLHNGQVGTVSALRNGVVVRYTNVAGPSTTMGVRHPPDKLEVQVPVRPGALKATTRRVTK